MDIVLCMKHLVISLWKYPKYNFGHQAFAYSLALVVGAHAHR